jgi:hypothetical protein
MDEVMLRNNRYKAERVKETVQGAYEKVTKSVNDARSKTARAKERSRDMAADLQEYASGGLDVSASTNRAYHQEAMHRFENGTRLKDLTPERVGAAGVSSEGRGR